MKSPKNEAYAKHNPSLRFWKSILKLLNLAKVRVKEKRMNKIQLTKVFLWKYTCFKPLYMFLASELIKNLYAATYATMLMKSSSLLHEAVRCPFSVCKHILSIFWGWKRLFSKYTEAEHKIHHSYKKNCICLVRHCQYGPDNLAFCFRRPENIRYKGFWRSLV